MNERRSMAPVLGLLLCSGPLFAADWQPITGAEQLRKLFDNTTVTRTLKEVPWRMPRPVRSQR